VFDARIAIVDALTRRDPAAADLVDDYHRRVIERTRTLPRAEQLRENDPHLALFLSDWLGTTIDPENPPARPR
jgi:hypothetical protein